jgi:hypothetical protein
MLSPLPRFFADSVWCNTADLSQKTAGKGCGEGAVLIRCHLRTPPHPAYRPPSPPRGRRDCVSRGKNCSQKHSVNGSRKLAMSNFSRPFWSLASRLQTARTPLPWKPDAVTRTGFSRRGTGRCLSCYFPLRCFFAAFPAGSASSGGVRSSAG